ncbi:mismatch repair ATPase [Moorella thermoacetica Y72]|uniref:Mismatch repair ATPase n=1 Tax=Moorella thermoacetica Y72 TaxID=1325331 RepID=A0A0S6UI60_NEOTH|nr:mismatch repair ATPase [Moorella thermoacetica Y72]
MTNLIAGNCPFAANAAGSHYSHLALKPYGRYFTRERVKKQANKFFVYQGGSCRQMLK